MIRSLVEPRSLRVRLTAASALTTAVIMAVFGLIAWGVMRGVSQRDATDVAKARAAIASSAIELSGGRAEVIESRVDTLDRDSWVFDASGRLIDGTLPMQHRGLIRRLGGSRGVAETSTSDHRFVALPVHRHGRIVAVAVAAVELTPYDQSEDRVLTLLAVLGLVTVAAAALAARMTAKRTLGQVSSMVQLARAWEEHHTGARFNLGRPVDEITELAETLDLMLDKLESALSNERRLSDEMAHELRTPLTVIRTEAELALRGRPEDAQESLRSILEATRRVGASIVTMLDVARSRHDDAAECDIAEVVQEVVDAHPGVKPVRLAPAASGTPGATRGVMWAAASPAVVRAALGPVLENAQRHARSRIDIAVVRQDRDIVVTVIDDGDGVGEDDVEAIFRPGVSGDMPGSAGLGLSVVRRLMRSVGGEVTAVAAGQGWFELRIPQA